MRGLGRLSAASTRAASTTRQSLLSTSSFSHAFSTSSGDGGGGGRGRGRGIGSPFAPESSSRAPGKPPGEASGDDPFATSPAGHGRGRAQSPFPSSAILPTFASFMDPSAASGRGRGGRVSQPAPAPPAGPNMPPQPSGRGRPISPPPPPSETTNPTGSQPKRPIFFRSEDFPPSTGKAQLPTADNADGGSPRRPLNLSFGLPSAGRGKEKVLGEFEPPPPEGNRHLRQRDAGASPPRRGGGRAGPRPAREGLGGRGIGAHISAEGGRGRGLTGERGGRGGRGGGGREVYARGGRGGRFGRLRPRDESESKGLYMGNDADGEKLTKRLGEDGTNEMQEVLDEISYRVLPCPLEDAYQDAVNMNNRIEFEPEYLMEFNTNPDIDEKPPMPLRDALEKMKPFLMEFEGIQTEEEWEEVVKDVMEKSPYLKAIVDQHSGPDRVTAKQQQQELERVAKTIPENVPSSVKRFTDRALLSLQSNPGWGWDKKCKFMDKLAFHMNQHYK